MGYWPPVGWCENMVNRDALNLEKHGLRPSVHNSEMAFRGDDSYG